MKARHTSLAVLTLFALGGSAYAQKATPIPSSSTPRPTPAPNKLPPVTKLPPTTVGKLMPQVPDLAITELSANAVMNGAAVLRPAIKLCNLGAVPADLTKVTLSTEISGGPRAFTNISLAKYGTGGRPFEGTLAAGACATAETYAFLPFGPDGFDPPAEGDTLKLSVSYSGTPAEVSTGNNSNSAIVHIPQNDLGAKLDIKTASAQWDAANKNLSVTFQVCNRGYGRLAQGKVGAAFLVPLPGYPDASASAFNLALGQDLEPRQCLSKTLSQSLKNAHYGTPSRSSTGLKLYVYDLPAAQMPPMFAIYSGQTYFPGRYSEKKFDNLFPTVQLPN